MTKQLTLSLDNGPDLEHTPRVLDILARRSIRAAFFMVGERVAAPGARDVARRVAEAGHRVGNHTMTHGLPLGLRDDEGAIAEIAGAGDVLAEFLGDPPLFRPNAGGELGPHVFSTAAVDYLVAHGYTAVTWNSVPRDWEATDGSWIPRALDDIERLDHTVLVLHDVLGSTVDHLEAFLDETAARGIEFSEEFPQDCVVIARGGPTPAMQGLITQVPSR
jgi:peptidoglycan/xylan/chitin deacetylase (PgdA/CDA1 family)